MHEDKESSENSYNFGFKIQLDQEARKTFTKQDNFPFDNFGFTDGKSRQRFSKQDVSSNSKHSSKIRLDSSPLKQDQVRQRKIKTESEGTPKTIHRIQKLPIQEPIANKFQAPVPLSEPSQSSPLLPEDPVRSLKQQIQYYLRQGEYLQFQSSKLKEKQIQMMRAQQSIDRRLELASSEVLQLNNSISELAAYQESTDKILKQTRGEKQNLIRELQCSTEMWEATTDQERKLMAQLEQIQKQFKMTIEQQDHLQMSLKIQQSQIKNPSSVDHSYAELLSNLNQLGSDYNKLLYNIKMSCLKPRWVIFENQDIQLGLIYETSSHQLVSVSMHVGNKTNKQIQTLEISSEKEQILNAVDVRGNSFVEAYKSVDIYSFHYLNLAYKKHEIETVQKLVIPFGWMKFGDFQVITAQTFFKMWKQRDGELSSEKCPVDTDLVSELDDYRKHFPNLVDIPYKDDRQLAGVFRVQRGQFRGTRLLCKFRFQLETYQVVVGKTRNTQQIRGSFLQHLCFLFSV